MPQTMKPGDTVEIRYWKANQPAPEGWRDVAPIGKHLPQGKIIVKVADER